jgi:iron(III) transport system substrate-binding protein
MAKVNHQQCWQRELLRYGWSFFEAWLLLPMAILAMSSMMLWNGCFRSKEIQEEAVLYCAQDQVFAEPILANFTKQNGIRVKTVFDSEAVKTVGLANRLLAERSHPVCDVFWGNEEFRTRQLAANGVFRATNGWAAFGHRSRRLVINTNSLPMPEAPHSLTELTNTRWQGKIALAFPLFGTTATHLFALRQRWGESNWLVWCRALAANRPFLEEGNSMVVKRVARGEALVGLTDSDDIADGRREGLPVAALSLSAELLLIPNTVAVVREAPHPAAAQKLFNYLQSPAVLTRLVAAEALEADVPTSPTLQPDWAVLLSELDRATAQLQEVFRR